MEIRRIVSSQCFSPSVFCSYSSKEAFKKPVGSVVMQCRRRVSGEIAVFTRFSDRGHLKYYDSCPVAVLKGEKKPKVKNKMKKKNMKLLKGLSRDLTTFSQIGFGLDSNAGLTDQDKGNMISEAAEVLLEHFQKLKAEEKERKEKQKEEKARLKAIKMLTSRDSSSSSSSSSSSELSSDSDCGEVINIRRLKRAHNSTIAHPPPIEEEISLLIASERIPNNARNEQCSEAGTSCSGLCNKNRNSSDAKIEVCMGWKCKKSGAGELLDKFRSVVGIEGAVSGCKCMGKCRDGPIVKVLNVIDEAKSVRALSNPFCIGVGLKDVDMIVANFVGA